MPDSIFARIKRLFHRQPREMTGVPEVMGHETDDSGKQRPVVRGWIKHDSLTGDQLRRIARLRDVLRDAYPMTMDGWVDGFTRDANPEKEIQIIEACAFAYQELGSRLPLTSDEKQKLYSVLCVLSTGKPVSELRGVLPSNRGLPDIERVATVLNEAWAERRRP